MAANNLIITIAAVVVIAAVVIVLVFSNQLGIGAKPQNGAIAGTLTPGGGPSNSYMSQAEAQAIFGPGSYSTSGDANATALGTAVSQYSNGTQFSFLQGNVTSYWAVLYNMTAPNVEINGTSIPPFMSEQVFSTPVPAYVYSQVMTSSAEPFAVLNATTGGMTYSYTQDNSSLNGTILLIGTKGNEVSVVYALGKTVGAQLLAATVAGDMP